MWTWTKNRAISSLVAAAYVLAITTSGLFHNHSVSQHDNCCRSHHAVVPEMPSHEGCGACADHSSPHSDAPQCPAADAPCPVCQFMAQKPAPPVAVAPVSLGTLVQSVASPSPARVVGALFSAWHSRAPPAFA